MVVGKEGLLSFGWYSPSSEPIVQETQTALMPFDEIAAIADTMLPVVVIGPSEAKAWLKLTRSTESRATWTWTLRRYLCPSCASGDMGSLQGTIVPVWDFWGTYDWYEQEEYDTQPYMKKGESPHHSAHADPERC